MHPLFTYQLVLARQDHLRREAAAVRSTKVANGEVPANFRWIRRHVRVEETRCATEPTSW
jgi:hypothetical protein